MKVIKLSLYGATKTLYLLDTQIVGFHESNGKTIVYTLGETGGFHVQEKPDVIVQKLGLATR